MVKVKGARTHNIEIRRLCIRMLEKGITQDEIADIIGVSQGTVSLWRKAYLAGGIDFIQPKKIPGRPRKLSDRQLRKLVFLLAKGPEAFGYPNNVWTLKRIARVIKEEYGIDYHPGHVWKLLRRLGFSHQRPERRARERDEEKVIRWKEEEWPKLRRKAKREGKIIAFLDESGHSQTPTVIATWAPRGETPIMLHNFNWTRCSIISAITPEGRFHYRLYMGSVKSEHVLSFLKHLLSRIKKNILLFWDGLPPHKSGIVNNFLSENRDRVESHLLPSYAPDLNPDELVYRYLKYVCVPNSCPKTSEELVMETRKGMEFIRRRPSLIQSFFKKSGLGVGTSQLKRY